MRAVRIHELIGPSGARVDELPEPSPGPGEILIDVRAAGLNFPDVLLSHGKYQFKPPPPFVPGGECAGVVKAIGAGVKSLAAGDRVAATMIHGAFAERVVANEMGAVKLPDKVSFEVGAATLLTYGTVMHALIDRAALKKGETVLVLGAAGGVGLASIHVATVLGARVIAACSSEEKRAFCKSQGAGDAIDYANLKETVKTLTRGDGANVIVDVVGGPYSEQALRAIAWEGRHLVVGFAAGEIPKIPLNLALLKGCQIIGVFWGQFAIREPERNRAHCARVLEWIGEGRVKPHIDGTYPFDQAGVALERMANKAIKGKVLLVP
jgi:NADPH2:quinone reductase